MSTASMKMWIKNATERLEESHPCDAQRIGEMAVNLLGEALKRQEALEVEIAELKKKALTEKIGTSLKTLGEAAAMAAPRGRKRAPKVWRDGVEFPPEDGVAEIQDHDGDLYRPIGGGKWGRVHGDGREFSGHYDMAWLVEEYGPIVEVGEDVEKIRWFADEIGEDFKFPRDTYHLEDGEGDRWVVVNGSQTLWETRVRDVDDIKEYGHWSAYKIAKETGSIMRRTNGDGPPDLIFEKGEEEPHKTIAFVHSEKTNWYYKRNSEGLWYAPGTGDAMANTHGKDYVTWGELLDYTGRLVEYRR